MTEYIVLQAVEEPGDWEYIRHIQARSAEDAIRSVSAFQPEERIDGTYVAVPVRSWNPVTVKAETRTVLTLEQPS